MARSHVPRACAALVALLAVTACAPGTALRSADPLPTGNKPATILLVEPDVELSLLTASGLEEPNAEWTARGLANVRGALDAYLGEHHDRVVAYRPPEHDPARLHEFRQLMKLHSAVGLTILQAKYIPALALPTKPGEHLDWTLGAEARRLRQAYGADYALFTYVRDSYASSGRVAAIVVMALFGVGIPGGVQAGFASLVDLRSGEIVWFNRLVRQAGDLRTPGPAREAVDLLLTGLPI